MNNPSPPPPAASGEPSNRSYPITLVTGYFELDRVPGRPQRVSAADYRAWMKNLLSAVNWPLVIFCDAASLDAVRRLRGNRPAVYVETRLDQFYVYPYRDILRDHCRNKRPNEAPDYSLVMNEKPHLLRRAMAMNPFRSEMFFWCDIGVFRPGRLSGEGELFCLSERIEWPDLEVCRRAFSQQVVLFGVKNRAVLASPPTGIWIIGGFFGGAVEPLQRFCDAFYERFRRRIQQGNWVHSEESILRHTYTAQSGSIAMRLVIAQDIAWLRLLNVRRPPAAWWWYLLSGERFPRHYFRHEIPLRQALWSLLRGQMRKIRRSGILRLGR